MRGITAVQQNSELLDAQKSSLIPCYIGCAPYWQVDSASWANIAGQAFLIASLADARSKIGFFKPSSGKWAKEFSICEAVDLHFGNKLDAVGPIIVLLNAASISTEAIAAPVSVPISNGTGIIEVEGKAVLHTVTITGKNKGIDYIAYYDDNGRNIIIKDLKKSLGNSANVSYSTVKDIDTLEMASTTFDAIDYFEQTIGKVPSVFAAPGWEEQDIDGVEDSPVANKLIELAESKINNHWYTQGYLQLKSSARADVAAEKATKGYDSPKVKVCWPFARKNGWIYSISTLFIVAKMKVDINNKNVPFESASNEVINIDGLCDESGTIIRQKESEANALNDIGIATCNFVSGSWRTWGVCMSNYLESNKDNILPEYLSDVAVQMRDYVCNDFQDANFDYIDKPIPTRKAKEIVDDYQVVLNALVNSGALLYADISFNRVENPINALANGEFVFSISETNTPPGKSITGIVQYTAAGLESYFSEEA